MKVITPLLSVLILGSMSVLGSSEHPSNELARKAVCMFGCQVPYPVGKCWNLCNSEPPEIPVHDVEAEASDILVCIGFSNEPVILAEKKNFIQEIRNQTSDWDDTSTMHVIGSPYWSYGELPPGRYELRLTRVFAKGISRSEIKGFTVPEPDGKPMRNLDMWVQCVGLWSDGRFSARIGFKPVVENPYCTYWTRCKQDGGHYSEAETMEFEGVGPSREFVSIIEAVGTR